MIDINRIKEEVNHWKKLVSILNQSGDTQQAHGLEYAIFAVETILCQKAVFVFVGDEVQEDGSIIFSEKFSDNGPYTTTHPAILNFNDVPQDWHWPYTEEDKSGGWVPMSAVTCI